MTSFCHQLRLLLWKNFILRKRHKIRMVLELIWPLFLFLILMWVRTRGLRLPQPACHLIEKAMPSVGGFPFLQNFICSLNNTCYDNSETDSLGHPLYVENSAGRKWDNAVIPTLAKKIGPLIQSILERSEGVNTLQRLWFDLKGYVNVLTANNIRDQFNKTKSIKVSSLLREDGRESFLSTASTYLTLDKDQLNELLDSDINLMHINKASVEKLTKDFTASACDPKETYKIITIKNESLFNALCNLGPKGVNVLSYIFTNFMDKDGIYRKILKVLDGEEAERLLRGSATPDLSSYDMDTLETLIAIAREVQKVSSVLNSTLLSSSNDDEEGLSVATRLLYKSFCGIDLPPNGTVLGLGEDSTNSLDTLRDKLRDWSKKKAYEQDVEVGTLCNSIFEQLESRPITNVLWRQIKPFIRGKILYYPSTPFTDELMASFDQKFSRLKELESTFNGALSILHRVRAWIKDHKEDIESLQGSVDLVKENSNRISGFLGAISFLYPGLPRRVEKDMLDFLDSFKNLNLQETEDLLEKIDFGSEMESEVMSCIRYNKSSSEYMVDDKPKHFESEEELVREGLRLMPNNNLWATIVFLDLPPDGTPPKHLKYKIRMDSDKVDGTRSVRDRLTRKRPRRRPSLDLKYLTNGFIYIQEMIEQSFIESSTGADLGNIALLLQQFPFPCHIFDQFIRAVSGTFPLFMVLSWVYASAMIVKSVVLEKELRLKEIMKVMGCGNLVIWTAWFIDSFIIMSISSLILSLILKYGAIVQHSDFTLLLTFMIIFAISTISFSFLISTFFTRANSAAAAGGIIFFVSYLPYNFMMIWEDRLTWYHMLSSCLFSNVAFGFGCSYISRLEEDGLGARWDRISLQTIPHDDFNFSYCMLMLLFDSFLYILIALYIEAVFPGDSGMPKPWYFLFSPSSYSRCKKINYEDSEEENFDPSNYKSIVEDEPYGLRCGVAVKNLCKTYSNGRVALSHLNMSFYEGQITSFLGHNGAGKTTTISILTGLFPPSKGRGYIYGRDICSEIDLIRKDLGICPQYNVLFDRLTVEEHLIFYADLKGKYNVVREEMDGMLFDLGIPHKKTEFPKNLSGGMKRKLSVAIAFVGGSRTVFLDEPTSGVDPFSRRSIWELLLKYKKGRTIILTTHFMDEADLLGDRIAIISKGRLRACGSSLFLKSHFGLGYNLRIVRRDDPLPPELIQNNILAQNNTGPDVSSNSPGLLLYSDFIKSRIPNSLLIDNVGSDLVYLLPYSSVSLFSTLFNDLDENLKNLHLSSYGISDTTLEDVFLSITVRDLRDGGEREEEKRCCFGCRRKKRNEEEEEEEDEGIHDLVRSTTSRRTLGSNSSSEEFRRRRKEEIVENVPLLYSLNEGKRIEPSLFLQIWVIILKRFRNSNRNKKGIFFEIILPALFIALTLACTLILPPPQNEEELEIKYETYEAPNHIFFSINGTKRESFEKTLDELTGPMTLGTPCMKKNLKSGVCHPKDWSSSQVDLFKNQSSALKETYIGKCGCSSGAQICTKDPEITSPPRFITPTKDVLLNVTKFNLPEWVSETYGKYESERWGGYEMYNKKGERVSLSHFVYLLDSFTTMRQVYKSNKTKEVANYKVWFENRGWISSVAYYNALSNMLLRQNLPPNADKSEYGITLISHPMNLTVEQQKKESLKTAALGVVHAICIIFALSFVPASFTVYLIEERKSGAKHLHLVSGVKPITYWISNFTFDMLKYLFSAVLCLILFLIFDARAYISKESLPGFILLLVLYGWASIPLMYPGSYIFSVPSTAFVVLACSNLFIGVLTTVSTFVLGRLGDQELIEIGLALQDAFLIFPHYCLGRGLIELVELHVTATAFGKLSLNELSTNRFEWKILGKVLVCLGVQGFVFFLFNLLLEYRHVFIYLCTRKRKIEDDDKNDEEEDEDVKKEEFRVMHQNERNIPLLAQNLRKIYSGKKMFAVDNISFGVEKGECFGLLGVNGAGKSSTFKMLTGELRMSGGVAYIMSRDVEKDLDEARKHYGYCPQEDGIDPLLNAYEQLELYGRLRGISKNQIQTISAELISNLGLLPYANKRCGTYSGGNRRKVSTAVALIGNPDLVFLDEPSSGMDPGARRQLWKLILTLTHMGKSVLLTSHSMEECEALCTRLAIMVNGKFTCLGSLQHLKNRFGSGYMLTVRVDVEKQDEFLNLMSLNLPYAKLHDAHSSQLKLSISQDDVELRNIFNLLWTAKGHLIHDFSVSQTTLDDIFVKFASKQHDELDRKPKSVEPGPLTLQV